MKGYGGRVLAVDLASGATRIESLAERTARRLLGGNGLAARLLYDRVPSAAASRRRSSARASTRSSSRVARPGRRISW
ncbi:MAG: hypothetical protein DME12_14495 [Candidatus Rokuibacteriota bacterium]|nr:MAG: hypothetical protein DME12_14495 [Candidatus Rokubacteria bacterium]